MIIPTQPESEPAQQVQLYKPAQRAQLVPSCRRSCSRRSCSRRSCSRRSCRTTSRTTRTTSRTTRTNPRTTRITSRTFRTLQMTSPSTPWVGVAVYVYGAKGPGGGSGGPRGGSTASSTTASSTTASCPLNWANYYWAIITHLKGIWKVFNRTSR